MEIGTLITTMEQWVPIEGFPYLVSSYGRVQSLRRKVKIGDSYRTIGGIIKPQRRKKYERYLGVLLSVKGTAEHRAIHRLVAQAFLPNPGNLPCVNHKDEDPMNNRVENLEWCDYKDNNNYGTCRKRIKQTRVANNNTTKVEKFSLQGDLIGCYDSYYDAARSVGKPNGSGNICKCCSGKKKSIYGFIWKYKESRLC